MKKNETIKEKVLNLNQHEINDFLFEILTENEDIYELFRYRFHDMSKEEINKMIEDKFNQIQIEENDRFNQNYYNELISFKNEWFTIFLKEKEYILVLDYILKILVRINEYVNWNEYKAHQETVSCIYNYLNKMLFACDKNVKRNIYDQCH